MESIIELLRLVSFFIGVTFAVPLIIGLCAFLAFLASWPVGGLIVIGCSPFVFIFLYLFGALSKYGEVSIFIFGVCFVVTVIIGFVFGILVSVSIVNHWYKSWFKNKSYF